MPIVELRFPNVLQTSVQIGDYAYFSNPTAIGPPQDWPKGDPSFPAGKTHTPHMTNTQSEIIMIGKIIDIGEWQYFQNDPIRSHDTFDGVPPVTNAGFIRCDMPQDLFNLYWDQILGSACWDGDLISNDCSHLTHYESFGEWATAAFDNPTVPFDQVGSYSRPYEVSGGFTGTGSAVFDYSIWNREQCYDYIARTGGVVQTAKWGDKDDPDNYIITTAQQIVHHMISDHGWTISPTATYEEFFDYQQDNIDKGIGGFNGLHGHDTVRKGRACNCEYMRVCPQEPASFIMFSKDNKANMSSILGYYASAEFRNNSTDKAELFNVGTVFTESSK